MYLFYCIRIFLVGAFLISPAVSRQIIAERPEITYWNPAYLEYLNWTALRPSRREGVALNIHATTREPWGNNVTVDFIFFEYLSNVYKRSFVELHYGVCQLIGRDKMIGRLLYDAGLKDLTCPYPARSYAFVNMRVLPTDLPMSFPFRHGRINISLVQRERRQKVASGVVYFSVV